MVEKLKGVLAKVKATVKKVVSFWNGHKDEIMELKLKIEIAVETIKELQEKLKEVEADAKDITDTAEDLVQQLKDELAEKNEKIEALEMQVAVHEFLRNGDLDD